MRGGGTHPHLTSAKAPPRDPSLRVQLVAGASPYGHGHAQWGVQVQGARRPAWHGVGHARPRLHTDARQAGWGPLQAGLQQLGPTPCSGNRLRLYSSVLPGPPALPGATTQAWGQAVSLLQWPRDRRSTNLHALAASCPQALPGHELCPHVTSGSHGGPLRTCPISPQRPPLASGTGPSCPLQGAEHPCLCTCRPPAARVAPGARPRQL